MTREGTLQQRSWTTALFLQPARHAIDFDCIIARNYVEKRFSTTTHQESPPSRSPHKDRALSAGAPSPPTGATSAEDVVVEVPASALQQPTATVTALPTSSPGPSLYGSLVFAARAGPHSHS